MLYKNSLVIAQIKEVLHNFNLPTVPVWTEKVTPREGRIYIKGNYLVKYTDGNYITIREFYRNTKKLNLTKNLVLNSADYDQYTHEYLGEYLRFIRDFDHINLMGMYNLFSYNRPTKIIKTFKDSYKKVVLDINTNSTRYDIFTIPVRLDETYTIKSDAKTPLEVACIIYSDSKLLATPDELVLNSHKILHNNLTVYSTKIKLEDSQAVIAKERYLRLLIKVPVGCYSNITILEGDWSNNCNLINGVLSWEASDVSRNENETEMQTPYRNSLLEESEWKPFSDRLVEYITDNAIIPEYSVDYNIEAIQHIVYDGGMHGFPDYWDNQLTEELEKLIISKDITKGSGTKYMNNYIQKYDVVLDTTSETAVYKLQPCEKIQKEVRFCDIYKDLTNYVDKDVEAMLRVKALQEGM